MILSSKVFRTPHIHLYSGISDRKELEAVGITTIIGNPKYEEEYILALIFFSANLQKTRCIIHSIYVVY